MEALDITYSIEKKRFTSTFKDVDISLLNAIRVQLLNTSTCWAFTYNIIDKFNVSTIDEETFVDMIGDIPVNDQSIFRINVHNDSEENMVITSNDLIPVNKLKIPSDITVDVDDKGTFKCLVYVDKDMNIDIKVLTNNTKLTDISLDNVIKESISSYITGNHLESGVIVQRLNIGGKITFHTSKKSHRVAKDIKLIELSKGEYISMTFVSDKGSPSDDPKWSAVSLASTYRNSSTEINLDFQVKSIIYEPKNILREAINSQIEKLTKIRDFFDITE